MLKTGKPFHIKRSVEILPYASYLHKANNNKININPRENEQILSQIIQGSSIAACVINKKHRITHWNTAMERLTGKTATEMIGSLKYWSAFYKMERPTLADLIIDKVPEHTIINIYNNKCKKSDLIEGAYTGEDFFPYLGKWLYFTVAPIKDIHGNVIGAIHTTQDFTESKNAETRLRASEDKFSKAFMASYSPMAIISIKDRRIIEANDRFIRTLMTERENLIGRSIRDFHSLVNRNDIASLSKLLKNREEVKDYEIHFGNQSNREWTALVSYEYITVEEQECILLKAEDITEIREVQKEIAAIVEIERQKIGQALHDDLGQNMTCVSFLIESLKQDLAKGNSAYIPRIEKIESYIRDTINKTRCISKMLSPVDIKSGLAAALLEMAMQIENVFLISCTVRQTGEENIRDSNIAVNLYYIAREAVNNAVKHAEPCNINIMLKFTQNHITMKIHDDGKGIDYSKKTAGMGFQIMKYRAGLIRANIRYIKESKGGFSVEVKYMI